MSSGTGSKREDMLLRLPMTVLEHILEMVEGPLPSSPNQRRHPSNPLLGLRPVCKGLRDAVDASVSRATCCLQYLASKNEFTKELPADYRGLLHRRLSSWPSLRTLSLDNHLSQPTHLQSVLSALRTSCPQLQSLRILNATSLSLQGVSFADSLHPLSALRTLALYGSNGSKTAPTALDKVPVLTQLTEMRLEDCKLGSRLQTGTTLQSLTIRRLEWEPDAVPFVEPNLGLISLDVESMEIESLSLPTTLTSLSLKGVWTSIAGSVTVRLPSLAQLALVVTTFKGPRPAFELPVSLTSLELKGCVEHEDLLVDFLGLDHFEASPPLVEPLEHTLPQLTNLRSLTVSCFSGIQYLRTISSLSRLEILHLDNLSNLTEFPDISRLKALGHLHVSSCPMRYLPDLSSLLRLESIYLDNLFELIEYPELGGWVL